MNLDMPKLTQQQQITISKLEAALLTAVITAAPIFVSQFIQGITTSGVITGSVAAFLGLIIGTIWHGYKVNQASMPTLQNTAAAGV